MRINSRWLEEKAGVFRYKGELFSGVAYFENEDGEIEEIRRVRNGFLAEVVETTRYPIRRLNMAILGIEESPGFVEDPLEGAEGFNFDNEGILQGQETGEGVDLGYYHKYWHGNGQLAEVSTTISLGGAATRAKFDKHGKLVEYETRNFHICFDDACRLKLLRVEQKTDLEPFLPDPVLSESVLLGGKFLPPFDSILAFKGWENVSRIHLDNCNVTESDVRSIFSKANIKTCLFDELDNLPSEFWDALKVEYPDCKFGYDHWNAS